MPGGIMAEGGITVFDEAKKYMYTGGWEAADVIKLAILDNTTTPTAAFDTPALGDFMEVETAGTYPAGGDTLDTWDNMVTEAAGVATFDDTGATVVWAANASNATDAWWGLVYNSTDAGNRAICFIELNGPRNMVTGSLTVTWDVTNGIFSKT